MWFGGNRYRGRHFPDDDEMTELLVRRILGIGDSVRRTIRVVVIGIAVIAAATAWMAIMATAALMSYKIQ
jgi:hypothetical protein